MPTNDATPPSTIDPLVDHVPEIAARAAPGRGHGDGPHVISYVDLLATAERMTELLRIETARHVYNMEPLDTSDPEQDVRTIARSRPPILQGLANMTPSGLSAILSSPAPGGERAPAGGIAGSVIPLIPGVETKAAPGPTPVSQLRPVLVVAREAGPADVCTLLRIVTIAADGLTGIMTHRLAPHAAHAVADASVSLAAELLPRVIDHHGDPQVTIADAHAAGYVIPQTVVELAARGHTDTARLCLDQLAEAAGSASEAEDRTRAVDWCGRLLDSLAPWPVVEDRESYENARQGAAEAIQNAFFAEDPEDDDLYAAILSACRTMSLPDSFLAPPEPTGTAAGSVAFLRTP